MLVGLTLLALALRAVRMDFQPLWWDEGYSVWFAHRSLGEMIQLTALDIHPPLFYAILGGWTRLVGLGPVALRLLSVFIGVAAVPVLYLAGRALGGHRVGLLAALLLAINPFHVFYSQEVRMYALAALWSLLAVYFALQWLGLAWQGDGSPAHGSGAAPRSRWGWLAAYVLALTLALYTLYFAALLALGLTVAGLVTLGLQPTEDGSRRWPRAALWLGAQILAGLLYLPWLLYAAPRLVPYVSQKVIADSDRPLGLPAYLARHLSSFAAGHLEGPLSGWWPLALLALIPIGWGLVRLFRVQDSSAPDGQAPRRRLLAVFLLVCLAVMLVAGWLINLTFPFFPERGERLLLIALPIFSLLAAVALAGLGARSAGPASGTLAISHASGDRTAHTPEDKGARRRIGLGLLPFVALAALSLAAFYLVPRYQAEDYRPLIGQVSQWGQPQDKVLAIFPWQVGYFWSYGDPAGPQPELAGTDTWSPALAASLDASLSQGHLWFPEHLSLGGLLEREIESYLAGQAYSLANRWYSPSTRLTGWATPTGPAPEPATPASPIAFADGTRIASYEVHPTRLKAANQALLAELLWDVDGVQPARRISLRLADSAGTTWAQQDLPATSPDGPDRLGLLVPSGTPPGTYHLWLSVSPDGEGRPIDVLDATGRPQGIEAWLAQVDVDVPARPPSRRTLAVEEALEATFGDDVVRLLGYSAGTGPLEPGGDLKVSLFWQASSPPSMAADLFAFVQLVDQAGQVVAGWEGPPVAWHPTTAWQEGEFVRSQHRLRLPATVVDGEYRLIAGLFDPNNGQRLPVNGSDQVYLRAVDVAGRPHVTEAPAPEVALTADLSRLGRLVGYDISRKQVGAGQPLDLVLHWQATGTTAERLAVFVHLVDEDGEFLGQSDGEPGEGALPTSSWVPGEYLRDPHRIAVDPGARPGPATLAIGLYDPATGLRVPWLDEQGEPTTDALTLPLTVTIAAGE